MQISVRVQYREGLVGKYNGLHRVGPTDKIKLPLANDITIVQFLLIPGDKAVTEVLKK